MTRLSVLVLALLIGASAPARAWCEASCLAPVENAKAHCPTHDTTSTTTSMSATTIDDCPVVESARPISARLALPAFGVAGFTFVSSSALEPLSTPAPQHLISSVAKRLTPLRI